MVARIPTSEKLIEIDFQGGKAVRSVSLQVAGRDQAAERMPDLDQRQPGVLLTGQVDHQAEVVGELLDVVDVSELAPGAAMPGVVGRVDGCAVVGEALRDMLVAAAVLADPMRDDDDPNR